MPIERVPPLVMAMNLVTCTLLMRWFLWPRLCTLDRRRALIPLVAFHWIRTAGVLAVLPGMTGEHHTSDWAEHIAIGDATTVVLAWIAVAALRADHRGATLAVWTFNLVGFADVINAVRNTAAGVPIESIGPQAIVVAFGPPALVVTHLTIFALLLGAGPRAAAASASGRPS